MRALVVLVTAAAIANEFRAVARSIPSLLTVQRASPDVVDYTERPGETVLRTTIDGAEAVIVSDAALDGLPEELVAGEVLVANGDRSFSLIMSAATAEFPELWTVVVDSVAIDAG